jgi:NAD(P)-dependent dehydrogenase (short-subunit alcohol dehydrogenase family)
MNLVIYELTGKGVNMAIELPKISDLFSLAGKSALVTGGTGSLGSVAAIALAGAGAQVILAGGNKDKLDSLVADIKAAGGKANAINLRPDTDEHMDAILKFVVEKQGGLDILMVASGFNKPGNSQQATMADFGLVMDANVFQTFRICRAAGKLMLEQGRGGKIVITSSVRDRVATNNAIAYCTSKSATHMLAQCFSAEFAPHGITVNAIGPALFRSPLTAWLYEDSERANAIRKDLVARIPIGRLGEPNDFAGSVVFLSSPASNFISGHTMYVDGGFVTI